MLSDFGIASSSSRSDYQSNGTVMAIGTPEYMRLKGTLNPTRNRTCIRWNRVV